MGLLNHGAPSGTDGCRCAVPPRHASVKGICKELSARSPQRGWKGNNLGNSAPGHRMAGGAERIGFGERYKGCRDSRIGNHLRNSRHRTNAK